MAHRERDQAAHPEFSVVISCLNEEPTVGEFLERLNRTMDGLGRSFEIIAVDDGSGDQTFDRLKEALGRYPRVRAAVRLFRNSGQAAGLTAGILEAKGEHFVFLDSDLQLSPEELPSLVAAFDTGADVVTGFRRERRDPLLRRCLSAFANQILRRASGTRVRDFGCTFKICHGRLVRACALSAANVLRMAYLLSLAGTIREVPVTHRPRPSGRSGWTLSKLSALFFDNLIGSSGRGFQTVTYLAVALALLVTLRVVAAFYFEGSFFSVVTPGLILNALFAWGLALTGLLCVVGEFTSRIFRHAGGRPHFVVRERLTRESTPCS